ncbi:MAG: NADH-quinone oxidoreductase subunit N, partial [Pseudomonas sp.]|nr:NADH-quinone oxidoreductase subunit N [Pseudomonas sp.]
MEFTIQHFIALAPLLITSLTVVVVMLAIAWRRNHSQTFLLSVAGLNLALLSIFPALKVVPLAVTPLLMMDNFAYLYIGLILVATLACVTLAHAYLGEGGTGYPGNREELYLLMLLAATGGIVLVSAQHLAGLFIGLELLSVPVYGLVAYAFFNKRSLEVGIK